jgi:DNA invertase Pin-like site-specific DNA recombinase
MFHILVPGVDLGYYRVSTTKQDLTRQIDALTAVGIPVDQIYLDKKSGASTDRPGLQALLGYARTGDVIVVHTLDRLGRTVRDTLNLIHELRQRGAGMRNLADPVRIDSADPEDPMAQLAVVLLALLGKWNAPTPWSGPRTPGQSPPRRAAGSADHR